jgi:hypothetical protein
MKKRLHVKLFILLLVCSYNCYYHPLHLSLSRDTIGVFLLISTKTFFINSGVITPMSILRPDLPPQGPVLSAPSLADTVRFAYFDI